MRTLATVLLCLFVVACGVEMKPGTEARNRRDIPPGPGALSGEDGEFVIFRVEGDAPQKQGADDGKAEETDKAGAQ